jgi:2-phosphosulfolactate phosphatase
MQTLETCLSPSLLQLHELAGKTAVIIDILRATSCMVAGLSTGVEAIVPVMGPDDCPPYLAQGFLSAGEHGGVKYEGFDMGNSPFEFMSDLAKGRSVVMTTTNGTKAIRMAQAGGAAAVVAGAFLNLEAVADWIRRQGTDVVLVCAGWKGKFSLEDTLFAGALAQALRGTHGHACDATLAAEWLYAKHRGQLAEALKQTSHAHRLKGLGIEDDIAFCASVSHFDAVPVLQDGKLLAWRA